MTPIPDHLFTKLATVAGICTGECNAYYLAKAGAQRGIDLDRLREARRLLSQVIRQSRKEKLDERA